MDAEKRESKLIVESMPRIMLRGHYDVFISYRRLDGKSYARLVYNELTRMFLDEHLAMDLVYPKLHVRFSEASPSAYLGVFVWVQAFP